MAYFKVHDSELGANDRTWLGSDHNIRKTHVLNAAEFSGDVVPSGTPVELDENGLAVPYDTGQLRGFLYSDYPLEHGDYPVAVVVHGDIKVGNLPVEFTPTAGNAFTYNVPVSEGGEG
ncbi:hypothetical protein [Nesterenkonia suensis]